MFVKPVEYIETPALLLDLNAIERNIAAMNDYLGDKNIVLRPHFKTVKVPEIALMQIAAGARGITCAKLSEAEVLADAGVEDILIANQIIDPHRIDRLAALAGKVKHMGVAVDTAENVKALSDACIKKGTTLYVLVELDVGMGRCGVDSYEDGLAVARAVVDAPNLEFEGIQAYEGHLMLKPEHEVRAEGVAKMLSWVSGFKAYLEENGIPVKEISGGGTGTYNLTGPANVHTELQAGSYIYMDTRYGGLGLPFEQAQYVLGMVIRRRLDTVIVDVGLKGFSMDNGNPQAVGFENEYLKLSEEHATLGDPDKKLVVGDTVAFIPSHCCTNINIYDKAYAIRCGKVEAVYEVKGRGKSQ